MPRPLSWLPRLHTIRRSVENSVRSHWGRREIERLFELQPRAAQKLLEALPSVTLGTARFVEREALGEFLEKIAQADDASAVLAEYQASRLPAPRRSLRTLVPRDMEPATLASLPAQLHVEAGRLEIQFTRMEELAEALAALAQVLTDDLEGFARLYEPALPSSRPAQNGDQNGDQEQERAAYRRLLEELERRERG
jgi:hypothetical protein